MFSTATVTANNDVYLKDGMKIEVPGAMTRGGTLNITPEIQTIDTVVVNITYSDGKGEDVRWYFRLNSSLTASLYFLGLRVVVTELKVAATPIVNDSTVTIIPYNYTVVNVSFNLTDDRGVTKVYANLTNVSNSSNTISSPTEPIAPGMGNVTQFTCLTPGQNYRFNITPWNSAILLC